MSSPQVNHRINHQVNHRRYLGLELSGAKNPKTTIAVLEYYPKEKKVFLLDLHSGIGTDDHANADDALIESIQDHADDHVRGRPEMSIGVSTPLTLPPCLGCNKRACQSAKGCASSDVKWMQQFYERSALTPPKKPVSKKIAKQKDFFTPYTQRPVELWLRFDVMKKIPDRVRFEIDEAMGGNRAPLTARLHYLQKHLKKFSMIEVLPKLTVALLMPSLKLTWRHLRLYRSIEEGAHAREAILERMCEHLNIFIYDRDLKKLTTHLNAFDAFICAYTAILKDRGECANPPRGFPLASGWVDYPKSILFDPNYDGRFHPITEDE
jgi:hypothetical protein